MKILHYSLGFPPYRTGGLTKFCMDLMEEQRRQGHEISLLWPGQMGFFNHEIRIRESRDKESNIKSFELINPLPVALDEGIQKVENYTRAGDQQFFESWLREHAPNVIHLHTLMGLHKEFLIAAVRCGIRIVYTPHDFFGICPKVFFFYNNEVCIDNHQCQDCVKCNQTALGLNKIRLMQHPFYRKLKNSSVIRKLRRMHRQTFFDSTGNAFLENEGVKNDLIVGAKKYFNLKKYYEEMIRLIDDIHFNSTLTKEIYERYLSISQSVVIPIAHKDIRDRRNIKIFPDKKLRIAYFSQPNLWKGYDILKKALDMLWTELPESFELHMYAPVQEQAEYMKLHGRYTYEELEDIYQRTDLCVAPTVGYDTFGYTVLEALTFGVPVVVSDHVGAKDITGKAGKIFKAGDFYQLYDILKKLLLDHSELEKMNRESLLLSLPQLHTMGKAIIAECYFK